MTRTPTSTDRSVARKVLQTEAAAILALVDRLDESFDRAVRMIHTCQGRVIVTGMGKSGIICRKIAATLASTGTSAFFLHPAEATHGDLRRLMSRTADVLGLTAGEVMTPRPITLARDLLAVEALKIMETHKITSVVVVDAGGAIEGVIHLHDLWRTQMI